eukprot:CAMPEP_0201522706 /NCGR_PEP_ID=MMETSP0161_2-20130828/18505_1 /ASSEMBLY_ACC=CAM_ASM_000251 /TAXON_ID=180227 /ORGANISM="Neoparamoeba aestuarina, Strain SoJaBio B1-5/56/2" /LENGTH=162 /DNA_ID=CAMNT_0047921627 /DNA_START=70 /DNA_END=555 /DNA_ORIENTATION=+
MADLTSEEREKKRQLLESFQRFDPEMMYEILWGLREKFRMKAEEKEIFEALTCLLVGVDGLWKVRKELKNDDFPVREYSRLLKDCAEVTVGFSVCAKYFLEEYFIPLLVCNSVLALEVGKNQEGQEQVLERIYKRTAERWQKMDEKEVDVLMGEQWENSAAW